MDGIVQRSVLFKYDLDSLNADFLSHLPITLPPPPAVVAPD